MYGYIYLTENLVNGKCYIGQHKAKEFDQNYKGSGHALLPAINKYGWENFVCQPIAWANSKEELDELEIFYIAKTNAAESEYFYNLTKGGECGWEYVNRAGYNVGWSYINENGLSNTPEMQEKRKQTIFERYGDFSIVGRNMQGENNPMYGRRGKDNPKYGKSYGPLSEEAKQNISKSKIESGCSAGAKNGRAIPIRCVETGEEFGYIREAVNKYLSLYLATRKSKRKVTSGVGGLKKVIMKALDTGSIAVGYHWVYVN